MNDTIEKIDVLMDDDAFVTAFVKGIDDTDALVALFAENNVDLTAEEIAKFAADMKKQMFAEQNGELDEDAMDSVAGGIFLGAVDTVLHFPIKWRRALFKVKRRK